MGTAVQGDSGIVVQRDSIKGMGVILRCNLFSRSSLMLVTDRGLVLFGPYSLVSPHSRARLTGMEGPLEWNLASRQWGVAQQA